MSADSLEETRPDSPGGGLGGPDGTPDRAVVTIGVIAVLAVVAWAALGKDSFDTASSTALHGMRDAVRAMVGDALTEQGPAGHPRSVAGTSRRAREDPPPRGTPEP
ncbi:hypothetical protein [Streptomyces sp. NBC_00073]|uniref:hypothetical protein n=1 Tax=Streptomyces sp. NBC_00073 TaxID=2975640 RepID=UPI0032500277